VLSVSGNHQTSYSSGSGSSVFLVRWQFLSQPINSPHITEPKTQLLPSVQQATCPYRAPSQTSPRSSHMFLRSILVFNLPSISKNTTWLLSFMFTNQYAVRTSLVPHVGHTHIIIYFTTTPGKQSETWINETAKQGATLRTPGPVYNRKS